MGGRPLVERVIAERQRRGLTVRQAAALTDITNTTWSRWENEAGAPSPRLRTAIAAAFGWGPDWPENPPPLPVPTDHGVTLADVMAKLDDLGRGQESAALAASMSLRDATEAVTEALERLAREVEALRRRPVSPRSAAARSSR